MKRTPSASSATNGRGLADQLGLAGDIDIHMGTLSKALGVSGGYVCGGRRLIDLLINRARSFIYSTAPPAGGCRGGRGRGRVHDVAAGEKRRQHLRGNLAHFADGDAAAFRRTDGSFRARSFRSSCDRAEAAVEAAHLLGQRFSRAGDPLSHGRRATPRGCA